MSIHWSPALSTGLDWQDEEHKQLVGKIGELLDAMERNDAPSVIDDLLIFLQEYGELHFAHEEKALDETAEPHTIEHKADHRKFSQHLQEMVALYKRQGASSYVVMQMQRWLRDFLLNHLGKVDKSLGAWVLARTAEIK
jgi:hemerythrin